MNDTMCLKNILLQCFFSIYLIAINFNSVLSYDDHHIKINDNGNLMIINFRRYNDTFVKTKNFPICNSVTNTTKPELFVKIDGLKIKDDDMVPYFNYEQLVAMTYSSENQTLSGVIDSRYIIKNLPISNQDTLNVKSSSYIERRLNVEAITELSSIGDNSLLAENVKNSFRETSHSDGNNKTLYPELLIVVTNDLYKKINGTNNYDKVLYISTLINAADMLYTSAEDPRIKLNIAGIIFETIQNNISIINTTMKDSNSYLSVATTVQNLLNDNEYFNKSSIDSKISYDYILILTSKNLAFDDKKGIVKRMSIYPYNGVVNAIMEKCKVFTPISIVKDDGKFRSYATIAHEIFHLINGKHHPAIKSKVRDSCKLVYLEDYDRHFFEKFNWSVDCCLLMNKPQHEMSLDDQCKCYGYTSHIKDNKSHDQCSPILNCRDRKGFLKDAVAIADSQRCQEFRENERNRPPVIPPLRIVNQTSWLKIKDLESIVTISTNDQSTCLGLYISGDTLISSACAKIDQTIFMFDYDQNKSIATLAEGGDFEINDGIEVRGNDVPVIIKIPDVTDSRTSHRKVFNNAAMANYNTNACILINLKKRTGRTIAYDVQFILIHINNNIKEFIESRTKVEEFNSRGNPLFCEDQTDNRPVLFGILESITDNKFYFFQAHESELIKPR